MQSHNRIGFLLAALVIGACEDAPTEPQPAEKNEAELQAAEAKQCQADKLLDCIRSVQGGGFDTASAEDLSAAAKVLSSACSLRSATPCADTGEGCFKVKASACHAAARLLEARAPAQARRVRKIACEIFRDLDACKAVVRLKGKGTPPSADLDKERAALAEDLESRCETEDWRACGRLAVSISEGRGRPKDLVKGRELFEKACEHEGNACYLLAVRYRYGIAFKKDEKKSRAFMNKACEMGEANGCADLGHMLRYGRGGEPDASGAKKAFAKACKLGHQEACRRAKSVPRAK